MWIINTWYGLTLIISLSFILLIIISILFYKTFFKRFYDFVFSLIGILALSPILLFLTIIGFFKMKGNPFFIQKRPGKINKKTQKEKIFLLVKFRTMNNAVDKNGNLLPDKDRITKYGSFLRKTSLDELPELFNIFLGDMSFVGPRPLLKEYLNVYTIRERKRHLIRPGLTGLAQVNGRNFLKWEKRLEMDVNYVESYSLFEDIIILFKTFIQVFKHENISVNVRDVETNLAEERNKK